MRVRYRTALLAPLTSFTSRSHHLKGPDRRSVQSLEPDPRCDDDVKDSLPEIVMTWPKAVSCS